MKTKILFPFLLLIVIGCALQPKVGVNIKPNTMLYSDMQSLKEGKKKILGKGKEEILSEYGQPKEIKRYEVSGVPRERYSFFFEEPDFINRRLLLDVYFVQDIVRGFNVYSGDRPEAEREEPKMSQKFAFQGM